MINESQWEKWKLEVEPVLVSKVEEWHLLGYKRATIDDVWDCFKAKLPRIEVPETITLSWLVGEIFHLKANDYMNWLTLQSYKAPSLFKDDGPIDL